jgi:DNA-binding beta-propeller fold protein YncE
LYSVGKHPVVSAGLPSLGVVAAFGCALLLTGCGETYRPVVSAINPVGPAGQPTKYAVAISSPSSTQPGLATFVDFAGDTVLSTPQIQVNPSYFAVTSSGSQGFTINPVGALDTFPLSSPTSLLTQNIVQATLPANLTPVSVQAITLTGSATDLFIPETQTSSAAASIAVLSSSGPSLLEQVAVPDNPVFVVGAQGTARVYAISQGSVAGANGSVAALESASPIAVSATIPVGVTPVYGVMTSDARRAFILNKGSGNVSVINVTNNATDSTTPTIPATGALGVNPVWADLSPVTTQLIVLSAGNGTTAGTLSIVDIPLCTINTVVGNPGCDTSNPTDATAFGTIAATIKVGINPSMVSVLQDGSYAYVINQKDSTGTCATGEGSVSVVSLQTDTVVTTICGISTTAGTSSATSSPGLIYGHPNSVIATTGSPTGKVYVTSGDNNYLSVIYTDTNTVQQHINLQGTGVRVLITAP